MKENLEYIRKNFSQEELDILQYAERKPDRMSLGNGKMPPCVGIFNLLAKEDCPNHGSCGDSCYALFRQKLPSVYKFRKLNSTLARQYPNVLKYLLLKQIAKGKIKVIRIHESGDFISSEYIQMWVEIATILQHSGISIFTMTKTYAIFRKEIEEANKLDNLNIIDSFIEGYRNYGTEEYCDRLVHEKGAYKCPDKHDNICINKCTFCLTGPNPCFVIHGTNKKKDTYEAKLNAKR